MTITEVMASIYRRFEKSSDEPDTTSEDFIVRLDYVNRAIRQWENEMGMDWKELYRTLSGTLTSGVLTGSTIDALKSPSGFVRIGTDRYEYVRPERVEREVSLYPSKKIYTITGAKESKSINVYPVVSDDFYLDYQKYATIYSTGEETGEIEMSNPEFIIQFVCAQLYLDDANNTQAGVEMQGATDAMNSMKLNNEKLPFWQEDNQGSNEGINFGQ